jgi:hypothetical protein
MSYNSLTALTRREVLEKRKVDKTKKAPQWSFFI